jgi:outer membrane immunogenic protein
MKTKLMAAASLAAIGYAWFTAANATQFDGVYIGLHAGAAIADADYVFNQPSLLLSEPLSFDDSAAVGGAQIGVRFDLGNKWVLGLEAAYTAGTVDAMLASVAVVDRSRTFEISDQFTATLQLGHAWGDWLLYVKGGYASAEIETRGNVISTGVLTSTSSDREGGWTIGAGIDHAIAPNVILGLSYDYTHYSPDDRLNTQLAPFAAAHVQDFDASAHVITARLSWKF